MPYVLEEMSFEDKNKVLADVEHDQRLKSRFSSWGVFSSPERSIRWTVNRDNDSYLFRSPSFAREMDNGYQFRFNGKLYDISISTLIESEWARKAKVFSLYQEIKPVPGELQAALRHAFDVYGLLGYGAADIRGPSNLYKVVPVFGEEG